MPGLLGTKRPPTGRNTIYPLIKLKWSRHGAPSSFTHLVWRCGLKMLYGLNHEDTKYNVLSCFATSSPLLSGVSSLHFQWHFYITRNSLICLLGQRILASGHLHSLHFSQTGEIWWSSILLNHRKWFSGLDADEVWDFLKRNQTDTEHGWGSSLPHTWGN